jgi:hypothetical protein
MDREAMIRYLQARGIEVKENITDEELKELVMERGMKEAITS